MIEQIRNAVGMASAVAEVPRRQAEKFARDLAKRGEVRASQVSGLAEEIVKRSRQNAEFVRKLVASEIRRQIRSMGLSTKEDLERINRRLSALEGKTSAAARKKKSPARKPVR